MLFQYFIAQSDKELVLQLDNKQYSDQELTEVKIPLHLPYISSWGQYERVDGEIEFNGTYYNYVKRKVQNDTLYLMCLPNKSKTELYSTRDKYARQINDIPCGEKNNAPSSKKISFINEYNQPTEQYSLVVPFIVKTQSIYSFPSPLCSSFIDKAYKPPKAFSC